MTFAHLNQKDLQNTRHTAKEQNQGGVCAYTRLLFGVLLCIGAMSVCISTCTLLVLSSGKPARRQGWEYPGTTASDPKPRGLLTVGAQQALKLGQQPDGVELPQEAVIM